MEQQEQVEWDDVNRLLQHHGFRPVFFSDPVENRNLSDLVLLDKKSAADVRTTLRMMLSDSERRQTLIQELVKSNNQLKEDVKEHMTRAAQQSQRATELEGLLDEVRTRVQDLEDRCLGKAVQQQSHTQQLQREKQEAQKQCQVLEQTISKQKEETAQLQRKLYFSIKEEEQRLARQSQTFQNVCKKVIQQSSAADQQVLDVIDFYETKMAQLLDELRSVREKSDGSKASDQTRIKKTSGSVTPSFKAILKAYQEEQKESQIQVEELKRDVQHLKQELDKRLPTEDNTAEISENISDQARLCAHYHHLLNEISAVVTPSQLHKQKLSTADFQTLVPTLELWAKQLHLLTDLQRSLNELFATLMPWQSGDGGQNSAEAAKVEDMMLLVDTMLKNTSTDDEKILRSPTRYALGSMVSHFQKLFDVPSLSGVYPRMNKVYSQLGEMNNAMRNLRDVLDLDNRASPAEVVNRVARLVSSDKQAAGFHNLLGDADIDSIVSKVRQHEEFFPTFYSLITDILHTLDVSHLDDILPALKSLKQTE
ncbi:centrosomal protein of 70 kDa isoform X2 [Parambassis ranga]|uniref:Centrosomal protein of 70 kDa n=1 Tax=Parambassis ranga TaxID=210632 RepID=A0A6P7HK46_9TELE|nr:centrosomal protein of 70 kDa isoform X2 [Parambassis ranga]